MSTIIWWKCVISILVGTVVTFWMLTEFSDTVWISAVACPGGALIIFVLFILFGIVEIKLHLE